MTKATIIKILKTSAKATICFNGLIDPAEVEKAREEMIQDWETRVAAYLKKHPDAPVQLVVSDKQISAGSQFAFLPAYPKTGAVVARSKDYIVADVFCDYADILADTFAETATTWAFQTKAGSVVIINKDNVI